MNKTEIIDHVAQHADISKASATRCVDAVLEAITHGLKQGATVSLVGFGVFSVNEKPVRSGRNPRTGETITLKASRSPKFKAGKALKDAIQ